MRFSQIQLCLAREGEHVLMGLNHDPTSMPLGFSPKLSSNSHPRVYGKTSRCSDTPTRHALPCLETSTFCSESLSPLLKGCCLPYLYPSIEGYIDKTTCWTCTHVCTFIHNPSRTLPQFVSDSQHLHRATSHHKSPSFRTTSYSMPSSAHVPSLVEPLRL